jgi:transcriptional regulator with XRE-family HTH domain
MNVIMNALGQVPIEAYKSMLPHGSMSRIAERAGVTRQTVSQFFSGRIHSRRVESAILDYLAELKNEREIKLRKAGIL